MDQSQPALPRLVEFDWRADVRTASDEAPRMAAPSLIVSMKIQPTPTKVNETEPPVPVTFELSREALGVMLDGLSKIRDLLNRFRGS